MRPPEAVLETRPVILGRLPQRKTQSWASVVARYTRDDWPPPEWLATTSISDPFEAAGTPVPEEGRAAA